MCFRRSFIPYSFELDESFIPCTSLQYVAFSHRTGPMVPGISFSNFESVVEQNVSTSRITFDVLSEVEMQSVEPVRASREKTFTFRCVIDS